MAYLVFDQKEGGSGFAKPVSNKRLLAEFTGISYNTLVYHFTRLGEVWHYYEDKGIMIIKMGSIERGKQRVNRYNSGHNRNI